MSIYLFLYTTKRFHNRIELLNRIIESNGIKDRFAWKRANQETNTSVRLSFINMVFPIFFDMKRHLAS